MKKPEISIIVPVYNAEKYLRQSLDTIVSQSFKDWELILVNDGSNDTSGAICESYAKSDDRIYVYHKENGGVSSARNIGLANAKGNWIYFCDSDDELYFNTLEILTGGISEYVDLVNAGYEVYDLDNKLKTFVPKHPTELISVEQMLQRLVYSPEFNYQGYLVTKLFRNEIIKASDLRFDTSIYYNEDRLFVVQYLNKCSGNVWFSTYSVYKYIYRSESATQSLNVRDDAKLATSIRANILILDELMKSNHDKKTLKLWKYSAVRSYFQTYNTFVLLKKQLKEVTILKNEILVRTGGFTFAKFLFELYYNDLKSIFSNKLQ